MENETKRNLQEEELELRHLADDFASPFLEEIECTNYEIGKYNRQIFEMQKNLSMFEEVERYRGLIKSKASSIEIINKGGLKLKLIKIQNKTFLENVISDADYRFFKNKLKRDGRKNWYFVVRFLAATGARVSELVQIKVEHVEKGYLDIYGKGGKVRRIYIPKLLKNETIKWLDEVNLHSGYLFLNRFGEKLTTRGVAHQLKIFGAEYGMNTKVIYPHSFRHRFAKNFLEKYNDLALLADLMGHESIETTRIYLRKTANEQQEIVDKIITW